MRNKAKKPKQSNKYHSRKITVNGETFDSLKEYHRFVDLSLLEKQGKIEKLQRQVSYLLIPSQYIDGKCVERACKYKADFVYSENGNVVVEDAKGYRTKDYIIKRKLLLYMYGIKIKEV